MNQLAVLNKHLRFAREAYDKIKGVESRKKADAAIREFCGVGGDIVGVPAETVVISIPEAVGGGISLGGGEASPSETVAVEAAVSAPVAVEMYRGNPVCEPVSDYEVKQENVTIAQPEIPPVEMRDGFPVKAKVIVGSRCINPKLLAGKLEDGRAVSLERGFRQWKVGDVAECELARAGGAPLYRQVNTRT